MKRHSTDLVSLVFGAIFLAASGWWLAGQYVHIDVPHLGWITAAVLIALGLLGLLGSLRGERTEPAPAAPQPAAFQPAAMTPPAAMTRPTSAPPVFGPVDEPSPRPDEGADEGPQDGPSTDTR